MRKTLLLAAAALAASVISSNAQVYSQNIVGYVNTQLSVGYNLIANPLTTGATNGANEVFSSPNDGDVFLSFTGSAYKQTLYSPSTATAFGQPTPWLDPNSLTSVPIPTFAPGSGFFYYNSASSNVTVTLVGTVVASSTNVLGTGYSLAGSELAVGGSVTNSIWGLAPNDGDVYLTFTGAGYNQVLYSPSTATAFGQPTPWLDPNSLVSVPPPSINVGQGFFYYNSSASANHWAQSLP